MNVGIILSAGTGSRVGFDIPKQYIGIHENPLISYTLSSFQKSRTIDFIVVVVGEKKVKSQDQKIILEKIKSKYHITKLSPDDIIFGGKNRQESVFNALKHLKKSLSSHDTIVVHDGARALIQSEDIDHIVEHTREFSCATFAKKATDTLALASNDLFIDEYIPRKNIYLLETPQCFKYGILLDAHFSLNDTDKMNITDDTSIVKKFGHEVKIFETSRPNIKLTTREDIPLFEYYLKDVNLI